jgi:hypothetical protein
MQRPRVAPHISKSHPNFPHQVEHSPASIAIALS